MSMMSTPDDAPTVTEVVEDTPAPVEDNGDPQKNPDSQVNLLSVPINNENDALNCLIGFLSIAQRRGVFAINESAKIFECVKRFHK